MYVCLSVCLSVSVCEQDYSVLMYFIVVEIVCLAYYTLTTMVILMFTYDLRSFDVGVVVVFLEAGIDRAQRCIYNVQVHHSKLGARDQRLK